MDDKANEKTEAEKLRLKQERAERRRQKKYEERAQKRGITVDALMESYHEQELQNAKKPTGSINYKKRSRDEMEQKAKCTVYVGNLVYRAGEAEIRRLFAPLKLGDDSIVHIDLPLDKETGKFYGVAFVQFNTPENAQKACVRDNFKLLGRPVTVQLKSDSQKKKKLVEGATPSASSSSAADDATARESSATANKASASSESRPENDGSTIFVAALADAATDEEIMLFFSRSGKVSSLRRCYDKVTKEFTGAAFVQFENATAATRALSLDRKLFHNRALRVEVAKQKTIK
jgi:RNA recognition motif-containing protein